MYPPADQVWFDGQIVPREQAAPSIASNSLHMALGVFDGLMAYWNRDHYYLHRVAEHLRRFQSGCKNMDLAFDWSVEALEAGIWQLLERCEPKTYYIRPICLRGAPSVPAVTWRNATQPVNVCILAIPAERDVGTPLTCHISPIERVSGRAMPVSWKACGVYVNSFLCQHEAEKAGFDTGIMLDRNGRIAEASTSNIFFIQDTEVITPSINSDIFPGITRNIVLDISRNSGLETRERNVDPSELPHFDASFLCATLIEIRPICQIGEFKYDTSCNVVYQSILQNFRSITHQR